MTDSFSWQAVDIAAQVRAGEITAARVARERELHGGDGVVGRPVRGGLDSEGVPPGDIRVELGERGIGVAPVLGSVEEGVGVGERREKRH